MAFLLGVVAIAACGGVDTVPSKDGGAGGGGAKNTGGGAGGGGGSGGADGSALYQKNCGMSTCHGALASSDLKRKGVTVQLVQTNHPGTFGLTSAEVQAIVTAIGP